ncbi:MAG: hypothetical protein DHS20C02_03560 [Micavibrio sp.]|nr:MAG: hypothetical protein DHS20C02_03560 [Micavibrio sp.]
MDKYQIRLSLTAVFIGALMYGAHVFGEHNEERKEIKCNEYAEQNKAKLGNVRYISPMHTAANKVYQYVMVGGNKCYYEPENLSPEPTGNK